MSNIKDFKVLSELRKANTEHILSRNNYEFDKLSGISSEIVRFLHYQGFPLKPLIKFYHTAN